jgi:hypothetical protein
MNRSETERPHARLAGLPGNARFAATGFVFGVIFIAVDIIAIIAGENADLYFTLAEYIFLPLIILAFAVLFLLSSGRLLFVRLFRWSAIALTLAYLAAIAWDALLYLRQGLPTPVLAGGILVLFSPLLMMMWRDLRRSRWLDPSSLPHEWELAALRDPKSINYRGPR